MVLRRHLFGSAFSAAAFLAVAIPLAVFGSTTRHVTTVDGVALLVFVVLTRLEYNVGVGSATPSQLALVPLLFIAPLKFVPIAVCVGSVLATSGLALRGRRPTLCPNAFGAAWFTLPPVLLLLAAGEHPFSWHRWPLYLAAVALQCVADLVPAAIFERTVNATPLRPLVAVLGTVYGFDLLLTPIGLLIAGGGGWAFLAVLPFTGVLYLLSHERRRSVDALREVDRLSGLTHSDALTGTANRRSFDERLVVEHSRAARSGSALSICLLDLDRFKSYNDTFGHPAGDELLRSVVSAWSAVIRPEVLLARIGGDEFGLILPDASCEGAEAVVGRLRSVTPVETTFSAGVVTWDGEESMPAAIERADAALYRAKHEGRNRLVLTA